MPFVWAYAFMEYTMKNLILSTLGILTLTACGGASTGPTDAIVQDPGVFSGYSDGLDYVFSHLEDQFDLGLAPQSAIDVQGSANYRGAMFLGSRTTSVVVDAVVGDMTLDFDLQDDSFSGSATDFVGIDGTLRSGTMEIANGAVTRTDFGTFVTADVDGAVLFSTTILASDREVKELSGDLAGSFTGDDAQFVMGDVDVGYEIEPIETGTLTITEIPLEGYFVVETD
jgi:hypothetical protein